MVTLIQKKSSSVRIFSLFHSIGVTLHMPRSYHFTYIYLLSIRGLQPRHLKGYLCILIKTRKSSISSLISSLIPSNNSLPSKIVIQQQFSKDSNSAVIGLSETKLDKTIFDSEVSTPNYSLIRKDRNRKGGGVACYIRRDICFNGQNYLTDEIENISFDLLLPKTNPISIAIVCKPPTDNCFLDYLSKELNDFNLMENDLFILFDPNINILDNGQKHLG